MAQGFPRSFAHTLCVLAGLANQGAQLLDIGVWCGLHPVGEGAIIVDQTVAPLLGLVKRERFARRRLALFFQRRFDADDRLVVQLAHQLADELHLATPAFEVGDAFGFGQRVNQLVANVFMLLSKAGHQVAAQRQQAFAQVLQMVALLLEIGLAHIDRTFELALEFQVQFAANGNKLASNEVAFCGFAGHREGKRRSASIIAADMKNTPKALSSSDHKTPLTGFQYSRSRFEEVVDLALGHALRLGAADAAAEVSEGAGLNVSVRKGELENVERNRDKSLEVTIYLGSRRGKASTSDFSAAAIRQTVQAAYDIAKFTAEDPVAGLPDAGDIADTYADLDLFHPWDLTSEQAVQLALACEDAAFATSKKISNSEGGGVSAQQSHFFTAHMRGGERGKPGIFSGGYASSRHSISVAPIAGKGAHMQRDYWYSSVRAHKDLASPESVGRYAAERALSRLNARKVATTECPVLFESPLAAGLLGAYVQATSGGALYRKTTFLADSLGKKVMAGHLDIVEDPHVVGGKGSAPFDDEGVRTAQRKVLSAGKVQGYFLSTYSARKLGMRTTGNAGGSHNLTLSSRLTKPNDDLKAMIRKLGRGLFVTELMGQGVNYVTGDYSRGASGYWVENGEIAFPVQEITIAGNLKDMLLGIETVGADAYNYGAKTVGSILINRMKVAGS